MNFCVKKIQRWKQKNQKGVVLWFTGYLVAGKTTIANELDQLLIANNNHSYSFILMAILLDQVLVQIYLLEK